MIEGQGRNPCFERAPAPEQFFPRKSHSSAFKLRSKKVENFKIAQKTAFQTKGRLYTTGKVIQRIFIIDSYT